MALSYVDYTGDGTTGPYNVTFNYILAAHVLVYVNGVSVTFTWPTTSTIQLDAAAAVGARIRIKRITPSTPLVDFVSGANLTEANLDKATLQSLYRAIEGVDAALDAPLYSQTTGKYEAGSKVIANVADPASAQDAVTRAYGDANYGGAAAIAAAASAAAALASETAADASEAAALASENAAAATYDTFDDRYLGAKSSAPTLDNDGDALQTGAIYWNTVSTTMNVWNGSAWEVFSDVPVAADIAVTPVGSIAATDVQAAIAELDSDMTANDALISTNTSDISTNAGNIAAVKAGVNNENYLINSNWTIAQRGTSEAMLAGGSYNYSADRWRTFTDASTITGTVSRQAFTIGQTDVPYEPEFFGRVLVSVAGAGQSYHTFRQTIENVRHMAGRQVTLSFYAKGAAALTLPVINFIQTFGSGGSGAVTTVVASSVSITSSWAKYTYTFTVPSISGKTIGVSNYSIMDFRLPLGVTFTFDIAQVKLELGDVATPNPPKPYGVELRRCQRYYTVVSPNCVSHMEGTLGYGYITFPVVMRTGPVVTLKSGLLRWYRPGTFDINESSAIGTNVSEDSCYFSQTVTGGSTGYVLIIGGANTIQAESEL